MEDRSVASATDESIKTQLPRTAVAAATPLASDDGVVDWDVYLGRGSYNSWRPGNSRLHALVDKNKSLYDGATNRRTKSRIIQQIYNEISSQGRFLIKDDKTEEYSEVDEKFAKKKIGHAFRDMRRKLRHSGSKDREEANSRSPSSSGNTLGYDDTKVPANNEQTMEAVHPIQPDMNPFESPLTSRPPQAHPTSRIKAQPPATISDGATSQGKVDEKDEVESSSSSSSIFSDQALLSVLGTPSEYTD